MQNIKLWWTNRFETRNPKGSSPGEVSIWTDGQNNNWQIFFDIAIRQGRKQPVGFHIVATPENENGLTTESFRGLPLSSLFSEHLKHLAQKASKPPSNKQQQGNKQGIALSNKTLAQVALLYRHAINSGISPAPYIALELGISAAAAAKRIQKARQTNHLNPARPGKPGEQPT